MKLNIFLICCAILFACNTAPKEEQSEETQVFPADVVTDAVDYDSDDPAIWIHPEDPSKSLILGTDKDEDGSLAVFNLEGNYLRSSAVKGLVYPNNVDVEQGVNTAEGGTIDIAVTVERPLERIRIFSLPDLKPIDSGGFKVFEGEKDSLHRWPMGVALYKSNSTGKTYVFVSRKYGPTDGTYIWQYEITIKDGKAEIALSRKFGAFSGGESEIEALMVDDELGFVYYSDEAFGIRKYYAEPEDGNKEVLVFGKTGFKEDREGIALWPKEHTLGYILISNQENNSFNVYNRVTNQFICELNLSAKETDGCEISTANFGPQFPKGVLVIMSDDKTFQFYSLAKLEQYILERE